jgi:addiction module RelE/StbE family toxin
VELKWSGRAVRNLTAIQDYLESRNPSAANKIALVIADSAARLRAFPQLGKPTPRDGVRELQVAGLPYLLPYRIVGGTVEILAVFDERMERPESWL